MPKPHLLFVPRPSVSPSVRRGNTAQPPLLHLSPIQVYRLMQQLPQKLRVPSRVKES